MTIKEMAELTKVHLKTIIPIEYKQMVVIGNIGSRAETSMTLALRLKGTLKTGNTEAEE